MKKIRLPTVFCRQRTCKFCLHGVFCQYVYEYLRMTYDGLANKHLGFVSLDYANMVHYCAISGPLQTPCMVSYQ